MEFRRSARQRARGAAPALLVCILWASPLAAKLCGDDVDGHDVPCACGDVVVSNVVLDGDPVVAGPACAHDGLVVRAPDLPHALVIDLHGHTLRGSGTGVGVRVVAGGPGGARVISSAGSATITGFQDGVVARGTDTVGLVEDIVVTQSGRDGLRISGPDFVIRRAEVRDAKRDGFALGGRNFQIAETQASDCGRFGYFVMGNSGQVGRAGAANVAERSGTAGFNVMGAGHALAECTARAGGKAGIHLQATQLDLRDCQATDNAGNGIEGLGNHWHLAGNEALRNGGDGIAVRGVELIDAGGNRGADNRGEDRQRGAVQCAISGTPCAL
jgi:hypothetical protein